ARERVGQDMQPERRGAPGPGSEGPGGGGGVPGGGGALAVSVGGRGGRAGGRCRSGRHAPVAACVLRPLVAAGSLHGPLGTGRGRPRYPADLIDSLLLLLFLAMVAAGVLGVWSLWPDRHLLRQRSRRAGSFGLILPMAVVGGLGARRGRRGRAARHG